MASQRWNRAALTVNRYNAMLRQPTPATVNVGVRYPTPAIQNAIAQPNVMHGDALGQYPYAWPNVAPMPLRYVWPTQPIPSPLVYGLPAYGWMQPTFTPHDVRPVADDVPLDLSRPRPSPPDLAEFVNVPVDRVATTTVLQQPPKQRDRCQSLTFRRRSHHVPRRSRR